MWEEIVGHQENKEFLEGLLKKGDSPHALLFYGPEGIGKALLARHFARAFLCMSEGNKPCEACESCKVLNFKNENYAHPDYMFVAPEEVGKDLKVEQIRNVIEEAAFAPALSKHKVCIINAADSMNTISANAVLKILEEPPVGWLVILIATRKDKLLETILSRVIQVRFNPLKVEETQKVLTEKGFSETEAEVLARLSDGSLGAALNFQEAEGLKYRNLALDYIRAFPLKMPMNFLVENTHYDKVLPNRKEQRIFLQMEEYIFRDLLFMKLGLEAQIFNSDIQAELKEILVKWNESALKAAILATNRAARARANHTGMKGVLETLTISLNDYVEGRL